MRVERATRLAEREDALAIRQSVFVDEQGVPESLEIDDHEETATHFIAYDDGSAVGTARLRPYDGTSADGERGGEEAGVGKVERVAIVAGRRGEGLGRELMAGVEDAARDEGFDELVLDSQVEAVPFYERLGYDVEGEEFEDAGIPHRRMRKRLSTGSRGR